MMGHDESLTDAFGLEAVEGLDDGNSQATQPKAVLRNIPVHLLGSRQIFLNEAIDNKTATSVIMQMRALAALSNEPITLWINSPGGIVQSGLAIYDTMRDLMNEGITIKTVAFGQAASMGSFILSAGTPGHRTMLPNAHDMTHQPSVVLSRVNEDDLQVRSKKMSQLRRRMESHYAGFMGLEYTKKAAKLIKNYMGPDVYLNAFTAKKLGLVDHIGLQSNDNKPDKGIKEEFLRRSVETDIRLNELEYDEIDDSKHSVDPARHVKRLIKYRDQKIAEGAAVLSAKLSCDP